MDITDHGRTTRNTDLTVSTIALSVKQAAKAAGLSRSCLYAQMRVGALRYAKVGARRVVLVTDLQEWLVSLRVS
jgi:excisionase family DNA binding protein